MRGFLLLILVAVTGLLGCPLDTPPDQTQQNSRRLTTISEGESPSNEGEGDTTAEGEGEGEGDPSEGESELGPPCRLSPETLVVTFDVNIPISYSFADVHGCQEIQGDLELPLDRRPRNRTGYFQKRGETMNARSGGIE